MMIVHDVNTFPMDEIYSHWTFQNLKTELYVIMRLNA
jgi:hypothetical protein